MSDQPPNPSPPADDEDLYCLECGYNLRGLPGMTRVCPECGTVNELDETKVAAEVIETMRLKLIGRANGAVLAALFVLVSVCGVVWTKEASCAATAIMAGSIWLILTILAACRADPRVGVIRVVSTVFAYELDVCALCLFEIMLVMTWTRPAHEWAETPLEDCIQRPVLATAILVVGGVGFAAFVVWPAKRKMEALLDGAAVRMAQRWHAEKLRTP